MFKQIVLLIILQTSFLLNYAQESSEKQVFVKVLSFNVLHGVTMNGNYDLDLIAKVIADADPDLVALQEVGFKTNRSKQYDLATELGWRVKMAPLFGSAMPYKGGEFGQGILSKYSFIKSRNVGLPSTLGREPRNALEVFVKLPSGDTIAFIGTHLDNRRENPDRPKQAQKINSTFVNNKYPKILAGDLNAIPESKTISILNEYWSASHGAEPEPTAPSRSPKRKIDYVLFHPKEDWKVVDTQVICDSIASDHCAYLVTLELLKD